MQVIRKGELTEIDGIVRVERGPLRRVETATEELLSNAATASHYQAGGRDAEGNTIEIGKPMAFIDWLAADRVFYVYRLEPVVGEPDADHTPPRERWQLKGSHADEAAALSQATTLAMEAGNAVS